MERGTRRPRTRGRGRGRGVQVRGGTDVPATLSSPDSSPLVSPPPPVLGTEVIHAGPRGGRKLGGRASLPGRAGLGRERPGPHSIEELVIVNIEDLPQGHLLETPLHPKRRRFWQPPVPGARGPPPPQPLPPPGSLGGDVNSGQVGEGRSALDVDSADVKSPPPPPHSGDGGDVYDDMAAMDSDDNVAVAPGALPSPAVSVPSQASFIECGQATTLTASPSTSSSMPPPTPHHQNPRENGIAQLLNFGSDDDSGESGDEDEAPPPMIPRAFRSLMPWGQDDDDDEAPGDGSVDGAPADPAPAADPADPSSAADPAPSATDQPWSFLDFHWRPFPYPPIPPRSRRETFSQINVGPTIPDVDPYSIFIAIWDRQFMEYIASETNRYAQQVRAQLLTNNNLHHSSRIHRWRDTTVDELYVYFAIIMAMGVVVRTRFTEYWTSTSGIFSTPGFSAHMSVNRFVLLNMCLHFANNADMGVLDLEVSEARLFKICPLLTHLNSKFSQLYILSQNIALDESLLMWKGCLDIAQLIRNKVANRGVKTYEVCESQTGYLWRFEVHSHKAKPRQLEPENPLEKTTPAIVLRLTRGLEYKGYTVWMDNFYNSPVLARRLKCLGFDCVGTLQTDRQLLPEALHNLTKARMQHGEVTGLTSGDVDVMVWRDSNRVATISTYHGNAVQNVGGATKPILIHDYNIMMGGVDKKDQMLSMFPIERKRTKVWYKKVFRRLLNVSVLNSFIIHRANSQTSNTPYLTHRNFRINLVETILSKHCVPKALPPTPQNRFHDVMHHHLAFLPKMDNYGRKKRRNCVVCHKLVQTFCEGCRKTCCLESCFLALHSTL